MQVQREKLSDTKVKLIVTSDQDVIDQIKQATLASLGRDTKVPGFRPGKAPEAMVERNIDQARLQSDFLEQAVNHLYVEAVRHEKLRPVDQPEITILKFVPFTTLEFAAEVETIGEVSLPDYKKFQLEPESTPVTAEDVTNVLNDLRQRGAIRSPVTRAAKKGDEVVIDFKGRDAKTNEPINGADGSAYPLVLGSNSFIPGFEDKLVGYKAGENTEFTITFPKDYGAAELQNRKVVFAVKINSVQSVDLPKADDAFAATVGPFKLLTELKADIKKQLLAERTRTDKRNYEAKLLQKLTEKTSIVVPQVLIDEEMEALESEEKRNLAYRGQTWQEHLDQEGVTAEQHKEKFRPEAERRLTGGLALAEIAEREQIAVTKQELEAHIAELTKQHSGDPAMQDQLSRPEGRRELANRLLNQKVVDKLAEYASRKSSKKA